MAILGLLAVVVLVITAIHLYLWRRLVRDTTTAGTRARRAGGVAAVLLALSVPGTLIGSRVGPGWLAVGYLWLPVMFYLLLTLLVLEVPMLVARRVAVRRATGSREATAAQGTTAPGATTRTESTPSTESTAGPESTAGSGGAPGGAGTAEPGSAAEDASAPAGAVGSGGPAGAGRAAGVSPATAVESPPPGAAGGPDHDPGRRLLLARGAAIFAGLTAASITGYGVRTALGPPTIDRVDIPLAKLPRSMDGFRIGVVSDIHLGPLAGRAHAERVVAALNQLDADLVTIVGDLVDGTVAELGSAAAPLRDLRSRRGVFFVTGNHEYYSGVDEWLAELPSLGVRVLRNERLEIDGIDLAGVNDVTGDEPSMAAGPGGDPVTAGPDYAAALAGRDSSRPVVLMAHQPVQAHEAARHGVDLQLSGHTHGGQMMPFNLVVRAQQPMVAGLGEIDGTTVYVSNGAGFWGPPVRVGAQPQVGLVRLRTT